VRRLTRPPLLVGAGLVVAAAVAAALVATGTGPGGPTLRDLALNGTAPRTAQLSLTVSDGGSYSVQGSLTLDFSAGTFEGTVAIPTLFSNSYFTVVYRDRELLVGAPTLHSLVNASWVAVPTDPISLSGLATDFLDARERMGAVARALGPPTISRSGSFATYRFSARDALVSLPPDVPLTFAPPTTVVAVITVGPAGQFVSGSLNIEGADRDLAVAVAVVAYDRSVTIPVPLPSEVRRIDSAMRERVFGTSTGRVNQLLTAAGIASLATIAISVPAAR
jgi:hypothetical protein